MKKTTKELLFERMHTIGGMPLKENDELYDNLIKKENIVNNIIKLRIEKNPEEFDDPYEKKDQFDRLNMLSLDKVENIYNKMIEDKSLDEANDDPCWDGYEQIGMKDKGGKKVPNCVKLK